MNGQDVAIALKKLNTKVSNLQKNSEKIHIYSEKSMDPFHKNGKIFLHHFMNKFWFLKFINHFFGLMLFKINVFSIFLRLIFSRF